MIADDRLPGLARVLDPQAFGELLERSVRDHDPALRVTGVRILDVQYAAEGATVLAQVKLRGGAVRRTRRQQLHVRVRAPEAGLDTPAERLLQRYRQRREAATAAALPLPVGALALPEIGVTIHAFPLDPVLVSLVDVTDPDVVRARLDELWRHRRIIVRSVKVETLSYTPEARAALRYEVLSEDRDSGIPEIRHLVGKLQLRKSPAALFAGHWAVWRATRNRVRVAPPTGYLAVAGLSLQEVVRGTRLSDLAGRGDFVKPVRQAAKAIATVHASALPLATERDARREARAVRRWCSVLRRIRPELDARLDRLEASLTSELAARTRRIGPVHSDFHLANVLVDDDGVILIDWDQVALGDPASDVGRFLGALRVSALRVTGRADALDDIGAAFLDAYLSTRPDDERQIRLFEACGLVVAAASPFRLQRPGWEEGIEEMIAAAERSLASSRGPKELPSAFSARDASGSAPSTRLDESERRRWSLDRVFAQALLVPPAREVFGEQLEINSCRAEPLSLPGGRLRIRWWLSGLLDGERWKRVVEGLALSTPARFGVDQRLLTLRDALAESPEALLLPSPFALLAPVGLAALVPPWPSPPEPAETPTADGRYEAAVGLALGRVEELRVDLGHNRSLEHEIADVAGRIALLGAANPAAARKLDRALTAILQPLAATGAPSAPSLYGLRWPELYRFDGRIGVAAVDDVVNRPRPMTVAELLADLAAAPASTVAARKNARAALRKSWLATIGVTSQELAPFEALALIGRAAAAFATPEKGVRDRLVREARQRAEGLAG